LKKGKEKLTVLAAWSVGLNKAQRFYGDLDHDRVILIQLPSSSRRVVLLLDKALYDNYL